MNRFYALIFLIFSLQVNAQNNPTLTKNELSINGTSFLMNGKNFPYTGISFFNAIYNPSFNKSSEERIKALQKLQKYGITVIRVWGQWDNTNGYIDTGKESTLYNSDGTLKEKNIKLLKEIVMDADKLGMM